MSSISMPQQDAVASARLYRAVWRWHFYAGLYVVPFLLMLAITGFFMMLFTTYLPEHGDRLTVIPQAQAIPAGEVAEAARASFSAEARVSDIRTPYDARTPMMVSPTLDRTVHVDQYTGKVLADVRYAEYSVAAKAMAVGIALHEGQLGWWNFVINAVFCLAVVFLCISGVVMWWKRRPVGQFGSPKYPRDYTVPAGALGLGAVLAIAFPLGGLAIVLFALIDFLLPKRLKEVGSHNS